jgi:hypothetical protein
VEPAERGDASVHLLGIVVGIVQPYAATFFRLLA